MKILSLPENERPIERLLNQGVQSLSNAELLAIILRTGSKNVNVIDLARNLLNEFNLKKISNLSYSRLIKQKGIGKVKASHLIACFELAERLSTFSENKLIKVTCANDLIQRYFSKMNNLDREHFFAVYLDSRQKIIKEELLFIGSLNESVVHPREIFKPAIAESAAAIILLHNHPSGNPEPSEEDLRVTKELTEVGKLLGIELLDHIIIGNKSYYSFNE